MSTIIKNFEALATTPLRRDALTIAEAGLRAIDTESVLNDALEVDGDTLTIQGHQFDLTTYQHIYIIGFGKVACTAAYTLEKILSGRINNGAVIGLAERVCQVVDTYAGTHPLPSQQNYTATKHIEEVARSAKEHDLVLVIISGGGSALLCSSMAECDQGTRLFDSFLKSGGTIEELNIVRKHISHLKGGGLAKALFPATVIGLVFSDVPGGDIAAVASGPTCFDPSTIHEAQGLIDKYNLGNYYLEETPKEMKYFEKVHNFTIVSNVTALNAMQDVAKTLLYKADLVSTTQYANAEDTKTLLQQDVSPGLMRCMGGETKVIIPDGVHGKGGRNGQLALTMLSSLTPDQVFLSLASDGHDNTSVSGALVDSAMLERAHEHGLSVEEHREAYNSFPILAQLGAHLETGILESNVSDLMLLLIAHPKNMHAEITDITAIKIKDSRGSDTLSVTVTAGAYRGTFSVPGGASTGAHEVVVLPSHEALQILQTKIKPSLLGMDVTDQTAIDAKLHELDGTDNFALCGGNLALGISIAVCKAAADVRGVEVWQHVAALFNYKEQAAAPRLFVNLINGGKHATVGSPIQEHQIIPDTVNVREALLTVKKVQTMLHAVLLEHFTAKQITYGDEGGFVIPSTALKEPFEYIQTAIARAKSDISVHLGTDIAASSFFNGSAYDINHTFMTEAELLKLYDNLHATYPMLQMVEDPFQEEDFSSFKAYHQAHPGILIIGDDLTTTNTARLKEAIEAEAINALIIKPNQIGTLTDTLKTMSLAYENKIWCIVSHRSGETDDDYIADLAFGTKCYGLKAGAPTMPERAVKYERLLTIQHKTLL